MNDFRLFESGEKTKEHQGVHCPEAVQRLEADLKSCLLGLATTLFGKGGGVWIMAKVGCVESIYSGMWMCWVCPE